jgi:hypothetical protein
MLELVGTGGQLKEFAEVEPGIIKPVRRKIPLSVVG